MEPSRLSLEHYNFTHIHIESVEGAVSAPLGQYAKIEGSLLSSNVKLGDVISPSGERRYAVDLTVQLEPGETHFPYRLKVGVVGIFNGEMLPEDNREPLVTVNGASLLYGVVRELVLAQTCRFVNGAVLLPTVHFASIGKKMESERRAVPAAKEPSTGSR